MDFRDLRLFLVVAEERSVSRAAAKVFLSQPALSRLVARVEAHVGAPLLERHARELTLTPAGERFCQRAARLLDDYNDLAAETRAIATDYAPRPTTNLGITVGVLVPAAAELTSEILTAFHRSTPDLGLRVVDISNSGGERALRDGSVDAAFLWTPVSLEQLDVVPLFDDPLMALLPERHPLADRSTVDIRHLAEEPYTVTTSMSTKWQAASLLQPWRHRLDLARPVATVQDALHLVSTGGAVTIGPRSLQRFATTPGIRYVPLEQSGRPTAVVCARTSDRRPQVRALLQLSRAVASRIGYIVPYAFDPHSTTPKMPPTTAPD
jgi:LysR family transcriptional regulator, benzoate and cis,cis-muconate-responsive activator of ben and cat genes